MDSMHQQANRQGRGHQQHSHGHRHIHARTDPPPTSGRLIRSARFYDLRVGLMFLGQLKKLRSLTVDLAGLRPGERVLDVGCGTGDVAFLAARRVGAGGSVWGIDAAPEMIEVARGKARRSGLPAQFAVEAVESLSFPDGSFDVVLSSLMVHHLPPDLRQRALAEIRRVLRPGGRIAIVDLQVTGRAPRVWEPGWLVFRRHKGHNHPATSGRADGAPLAAILREAGFEAVENGPTRYSWIGYARGRVPA